jgi:hypothetical protein
MSKPEIKYGILVACRGPGLARGELHRACRRTGVVKRRRQDGRRATMPAMSGKQPRRARDASRWPGASGEREDSLPSRKGTNALGDP